MHRSRRAASPGAFRPLSQLPRSRARSPPGRERRPKSNVIPLPSNQPPVTRFAPSPTGLLHLGHVRAAAFAHRLARQAGGTFLLRLEDIDPARCRPDHADAILEDLAWLGLTPDGPVRRQSDHLEAYAATVSRLADRRLVYPCFCSRAEIAREAALSLSAPHDPDGAPLYPGTCRNLAGAAARIEAGHPHAWRLDIQAALQDAGTPPVLTLLDGTTRPTDPARFGDAILARRDVPTSYHLACTHDDALQGVTIVTRADDLAPAADLHRLLQTLMSWPAPRYAFHPLVLGSDGRKLSKRDAAVTIRALRAQGLTPADIRQRAAA